MLRRIRRHPLATCGILAPAVFFGASLAAAAAQPSYSSRTEDLSALAALNARDAWIMVAGTVALGVMVIAFAIGLLLHYDQRLRPAAYPLLVAGLATAAAGGLRIDCSERVDAACAARSNAGLLSWRDEAYNLMAALLLVTFSLAPLVAAHRLRGSRETRRLAWASSAVAAAIAVLAAVYFSEVAGSWSGSVERVMAGLALAWVAAAAWRLLSGPEPAPPDRARAAGAG